MRADGPYKWFVVAMLWSACFLNYADRQLIFTVFPLLSSEFHLTDAALSAVSASFMCAYAVFGPVAGVICDRISRRSMVLGALAFWSATAFAVGFVHGYGPLIAGVAMSGLGEAFYFPAALSMIADYHAVDTRSRAMAFHQSSVYVGSIVGGALAGYIGQFYGWRLGFRAFGSAGIALACALWLLLKEPRRGFSDALAEKIPAAGQLLEEWRELARNHAAWLLVVIFIGANFVAMIFTVWMPTYLVRAFHMSLSMAGLNGTAYLQIASIVGVVSGGALADRSVRRRRGDRGARMRVQAMGLFFGVPFLFLSGWAAAVTVTLAAMIGFGFFKGVYDSNIFASLFDVIPIELRGTALGVMNSLGWLGGAAAQLCIGIASQRFGLSLCLSATAAIYLAIAFALWIGARRLTGSATSTTVGGPPGTLAQNAT
jgi:MFS family permease